MKFYLLPLICFVSFFANAQTSNIQIYSENQEPFNLSINGQTVSSIHDNTHKVTGMMQGANYEILIDYTMPNTSDIKTTLNIMRNNESGVLTYMVPKFFQGSLIYQGVNKLDNDASMNGNVSINMNINQQGLNVSMGMDNNQNSSQTSTTSNQSYNTNSTPNTNETNSQETNVVYVEGYSGKIGCSTPVSEDRFKSMMESIDNASFAEDKVRVAKRILKTNCLTIDNLVLILEEISFDEDQLDLAKFAYDHVYDLENYYKVYDVFSFSKSGEELEEYIENR
tara:strand:- start:493 stop:1335 length:843 start_codon:yes stop_codon:yes gene_type:complete